MSGRPQRQDFISRIRYTNPLPPPPCPPKLLSNKLSLEEFKNPDFISPLLYREPPNMDSDIEIGMPLDLTIIPGVFDFINNENEFNEHGHDHSQGSEEGNKNGLFPMYESVSNSNRLKLIQSLDPKDAELFNDNLSLSNMKSQPNVSFLRRTEYISGESIRMGRNKASLLLGGNINNNNNSTNNNSNNTFDRNGNNNNNKYRNLLDVDEQIKRIEETFEAGNSSISNLRHPKKRNLTAVDSWELLPDTSVIDLNYLILKFTGSSAHESRLGGNNTNNDYESLNSKQTALYLPATSETDEWMSFYMTPRKSAKKLRESLKDPNSFNDDIYRFKHIRDYNMEFKHSESRFDELIITFANSDKKHNGTAYYKPTAGRTLLKRRRIAGFDFRFANENITSSISAIDLQLRPSDEREVMERDNARNEYDPESYKLHEIPIEETEKEKVDGDDLDELEELEEVNEKELDKDDLESDTLKGGNSDSDLDSDNL